MLEFPDFDKALTYFNHDYRLYSGLAPESDIYLHTQTWSHTAVYLCRKLGFEFSLMPDIDVSRHKEPGFRVMTNSP